MRRCLIILLVVALPGCSNPPFSWMKGAKSGTMEQSDKHSMVEKTSAEVLVIREPGCDGPELPDLKYDVMGKTVSAPAGSKVMIQVGSKATERSSSIVEALGNFKMTTSMGFLIVGGSLAVVLGVVGLFLGLGWYAGIAIAGGITAICLGVTIEQHPEYFVILLGVGVCAGVLALYRSWKARQTAADSGEKSIALAEIVKAIESLSYVEQTNLKTKLAMTDVSATVRKVVDKVKGRSK